jgi:hypothetical protein
VFVLVKLDVVVGVLVGVNVGELEAVEVGVGAGRQSLQLPDEPKKS